MPGKTASLGTALLLWLAAGSLQAQVTSAWQRPLDSPSSERLDIHLVDGLPDGGFRITGGVAALSVQGGYYAAVQDFDPSGQAVGPPRLGPLPRLRSGRSAEPDVVAPFEPMAFTMDLQPRDPAACLRSDLGGGVERRLAERAYHSLSYELGRLDGEGGAFAASWGLREGGGLVRRLYRQQMDCSVEPINDYAFDLGHLVNSSREALVFASSSVDGSIPGRSSLLRAFGREGQRWSLTFKPGGEAAQDVYVITELEGEVIVGAAGPTQAALYRVDSHGALRWTLPLGAAGLPAGGESTPQGLLVSVVRRHDADSSTVEFVMIDPDAGSVIWRYGAAGMPRASLIPHAGPDATRRLVALGYGGDSLIELDGQGGASALRTLPFQLRPRLQLADGRLLLTEGSAFGGSSNNAEPGRRLLIIDPYDAQAPIGDGQALRVSWPQRPLKILAEGDRVFVASLRDARLLLQAFDEGGALRWQQLLPEFSWGGRTLSSLRAALFAVDDRVCVALQRDGGSGVQAMNALSCVERSDGATRFTNVDLISDEDTWSSSVRVLPAEGEGTQAVLLSRRQCSPPNACPGSIDRVIIDASGGTTRQTLLSEDATRRIVLFWPLDAQRLLVATEVGAALQWLRLDPDGAITELQGGVPWVPAGYAHSAAPGGGLQMVVQHPQLALLRTVRFDASGGLLWSRELESRLYPIGVAYAPALVAQRQFVAASAQGDAAVLGFVDQRLQLTRLDDQGNVLWQREIGDGLLDSTLGLQLDPDGSLVLAQQRGQRVLLRRLSSVGEDVAAGLQAVDGPALDAAGWIGKDALLVTEGARPHAAAPQPATLQRLRLDRPTGCSGPPLSGFWFDPGSAGQGLFFHPAAEGDLLTATWLSFAINGKTDRADLRWFSAFGGAAGDGSIQLTVQSSAGGRFASVAAEQTDSVGSLRVQRYGCALLAVDYAFDAGEFAGRSGRSYLQPAAPPTLGELGGIWFAPESAGQGLLLQTITADSGTQRLVGAWASFDPEGAVDDASAQHWFTLDGARKADGSFDAVIVRTIGGSFDGRATANHLQVGEAQLRFTACDRLQLDYRFDDRGAAEFAGLHGSLWLQRLDACPPD